MKYLAIDYGTKRVGTAISDPLGVIARPYQLLTNDDKLVAHIEQIIIQEKVQALVLGLPKHMNNSLGEKVEAVEALKHSLNLGIPIYFQDERRSTAEAERVLIAADVSRADRKQKIDNLAATIILQTFLDSH